ncbi:MAG: type I methionyl aminopeptidase [Clostridia bacterium]|nr:type I methionyl aminopeptidase [Clostridia bacterium]
MVIIKSDREIQKIKEAGHIVYLALKAAGEAIKPGITTAEINEIAEQLILSHGGNPSCKGYPKGDPNPFPAGCCISVNDEVIHGIPGDRKLKDGDLVSVDIVVDKDGYFADATRSFVVGNNEKAERLIEVTKQSFFEGIKYAKVGNRISDISSAIQEYVEKNGYSIVREFQGHGVGVAIHEEPGIPNFGKPGKGPRIQKGMVLAIEPMVNEGESYIYEADDGWTILTEDGSLAAHYENTIAITEKGPIILTDN